VRNQALVTQALAYSPNCHLATLALLPVPGQRENLVQRIRRWLADQAVLQHRCQVTLLKQVQPYLPNPKRIRITLYGDCEFRAVEMQQYCRAHHWHWQLGLKSDTLFRQGTADWQPLQAIGVTQGQRHYIQDVTLTQQHAFGPVSLTADWTNNEDTPRYVVTDQRADRYTWCRGRKRFWIEPFFRDWKSYGFDLESSKLVHPHRLETLLLGMATATLWMVHVGQWVIETDRHHLLEAPHKHDYSGRIQQPGEAARANKSSNRPLTQARRRCWSSSG
jgi:hypothetical protein